jgi:subtilisin family serine protease
LYNPGEQGLDSQGNEKATNGKDDDHNGYVDDVVSFDFYANKTFAGDYGVHGTHIGGIIAGKHSDVVAHSQSYVQGIAPKAKLLPVAFLGPNGGNTSDGIRAINYAVARGARVINASWGGEFCSRSLRDTITALNGKNVLFATAAGNNEPGHNVDRQREYPASLDLPAQITVGSISSNDFLSYFSNYGTKTVHIFSPGDSIVSTAPGGGYVFLSGTSMATPFVAGAAALLWGAEPTATIAQIREALYESSVKRDEYINASKGRLQLGTALSSLRDIMQH